MSAQPARNWADLKRRGTRLVAIETGTAREFPLDVLSRSDLSRLVGMVGGFVGTLVGADVTRLRAHITNKCDHLTDGQTFYGRTPAPTPQPTPQPTPAPAPAPEVHVTPAPAPEAPPAPPAGSLDAMLASIAEAATLRVLADYSATIEAKVTTALAKLESPVVRIEVKRPDDTVHKVEGHTHPAFAEVCEMLADGLHVMLVGPAGSGKSHLAAMTADAFGRPFFMVNCSADMGRHDLFGYNDAQGAYVTTPLFDSLDAGDDGLGGLFLLDEADAATPDVLVSYNGLAAQRHAVFGRSIRKAGPEWRTILACNTFGMGPNATYPGRRPMDYSTKDRTNVVFVDYDRGFERKMATAILGDESTAVRWCMAIDKLRANVAEHKLAQIVVSTRQVIDGAMGMARGRTPERVLDRKSLAGIEGPVRDKVLAGVDLKGIAK